MFRVNVLTGDYTVGNGSLITAPPKDPNKPSIKYDSVVDAMQNMEQWVVFTDAQAYAEHLVVYTG